MTASLEPLSLDQHLQQIMAVLRPLPAQELDPHDGATTSPLLHLAKPAIATNAVPPFSNSAVDGFLVRDSDLAGPGPWTLPVSDDVAAGSPPLPVRPGTAIRIMTGAPTGEDTSGLRVVPIEHTTAPSHPTDHRMPAMVTITAFDSDRRNIRLRGEHLQAGDVVVAAGSRLDAGALATALSSNSGALFIHRLPRVAVVTTGDELTSGPWSIPNSNGPMLVRMLRELGVQDISHFHLSDDVPAFAQALDRIGKEADLIVTTGGISAGAYDVVRLAAQREGSVRFDRVAMRPGQPQGAGLWHGTPMICLPGNPVASWVSVPLFVAPAIRRLAGAPAPSSAQELASILLPVRGVRPRANVTQAVPVKIGPQEAQAPARRRSHMIGATVGCDGLALVPPSDLETANADETLVPVIPLP